MTYLSPQEVIDLHVRVVAASGGSPDVLNRGLVESAVELPRQGFGGVEFYPTLAEKAACLGFALASNHAFADGNKRIAHAAMELFLLINGHELVDKIDAQEALFWGLAAKTVSKDEFFAWVASHVRPNGLVPP